MHARITIELTTDTPDTGSGMPDLGHDTYWLMKELPKLNFKDASGNLRPLSDKYKITLVRTEAQ